jgi:hypothetical protein
MQMKVHSLKIVRATYSFVWGNRLECLRILWLPLVLMFLLAWIVCPHISRFVNACVRATAATSISSSSAVAVSLWVVFLFAGLTVLMSIKCAGLWRLILRNVHVKAPFYLGFENDELRLLALAGLKVLMLIAWAVVTAVVIGLVEFVVAHISQRLTPHYDPSYNHDYRRSYCSSALIRPAMLPSHFCHGKRRPPL